LEIVGIMVLKMKTDAYVDGIHEEAPGRIDCKIDYLHLRGQAIFYFNFTTNRNNRPFFCATY